MTPVSLLRAQAIAAAQRHARRERRVMQSLAKWTARRDSYLGAVRALAVTDPMRARAVLLAEAAGWRLAAWQALAEGDAAVALHRWRRAAGHFRNAMRAGVVS